MKKVMALIMVAGMVALYACGNGNKTEGNADSTMNQDTVQVATPDTMPADTAAVDTTVQK